MSKENRPKIIAVTMQKGGTGKTACAVNIAATLSTMYKDKKKREKYKVLIIDMDVHSVSTLYAIRDYERRLEIYDVLTTLDAGANKVYLDDVIKTVEHNFGRKGVCSFDIAPSSDTISRIDDIWKPQSDTDKSLKRAIEESEKVKEYDYVIIDCPNEGNALLANAYMASDYYLFTCLSDKVGFNNLSMTYKQLNKLTGSVAGNSKIKNVLGFVINNYRKNTDSLLWLEQFNKLDTIHPFKTIIPRSENYGLTVTSSTPIPFFHRNYQDVAKVNRVYRAYRELTDEFIERINFIDSQKEGFMSA